MEIIYSDKNIAVCIKPVCVDSEKQMPDLIKANLGGEVYTVHRLDKNVGGVMVYARSRQAASQLSKAIQSGSVIKEYVAIVHGTPPEKGDWEDLLFKDSNKNKVFVVKRMRKGVKHARLEYVRISDGEFSLVRIRLHTGRSHQIRVQFSSRGYPLVGDRKYGAKDNEKSPMLYSCKITFPYNGQSACFEALPDWKAIQNKKIKCLNTRFGQTN